MLYYVRQPYHRRWPLWPLRRAALRGSGAAGPGPGVRQRPLQAGHLH